MRILLVAAELAELAPVGGVAEYNLGLASALLEAGHDVHFVLPEYAFVAERCGGRLVQERGIAELGFGAPCVFHVRETSVPRPGAGSQGLLLHLVGGHPHFSSVRSEGHVYSWPNHEPWVWFSRAVVDHVRTLEWEPDVVHAQDSHCSLIPVYVKKAREERPKSKLAKPGTVLTVHNVLNQGQGPPSLVEYAGLPLEMMNQESFEFHGKANTFKAGLLSADQTSTVSRTYAREICQSQEYGFGLEGVFCRLRDEDRLRGIVNGIDEARWSMADIDYEGERALLIRQVSDRKRERKRAWCSSADVGEADLPIVGFRARWDLQKGIPELVDSVDELAKQARLVLCTWGYPGETGELRELWSKLSKKAESNPSRIVLNPMSLAPIEKTADHYLLCDLFLMPSRYEPCGLGQMECQRFGAIPVVRRTGGLADTVSEEAQEGFPSPNGFTFSSAAAQDLIAAVKRGLSALSDPPRRGELLASTLLQRNAWAQRVPQYYDLYRSAIEVASRKQSPS